MGMKANGLFKGKPIEVSEEEIRKLYKTDSKIRHHDNWLHCIKTREEPVANVASHHRTVSTCHLGNIAHRTGDSLTCNAENGHIIDNEEAMKLWKRDYEPGWEPQV